MRRLLSLSAVALLALGACGGDDSNSNTDDTVTDDSSVAGDAPVAGGEYSEEYCQDLTAFLTALDGIPGETAEDTEAAVETMNSSLNAMRESTPDGLEVDYDSVESVANDIVELLADYDNDASAVEADPEGAARLAEIQEADGNMDNFIILGSYYESNCVAAEQGS